MSMVMTDQRRGNGVEIAFAVVLTVFTGGYLLPWLIAACRGKSNSLAVGLLNFFLGWTFVGWVVSLVMACTAHQVVGMHPLGYAPIGYAPPAPPMPLPPAPYQAPRQLAAPMPPPPTAAFPTTQPIQAPPPPAVDLSKPF